MTKSFDHAEDVLRFFLDHRDAALVILSDVSGGTIRAKGAMMAVTPEGHAGYISNGCVDEDIISRARSGHSGMFLYGDGSPYRDINLPCGGAIEVLIVQNIDPVKVERVLSSLSRREPTILTFEKSAFQLWPRLKLRIAGRGAVCSALAELGLAAGFLVHVQSPDPEIFPQTEHLLDIDRPPQSSDDERVAFICLFHDHDWEAPLLKQALEGPAFYVGAMGSQRTHEERCKKLSLAGVAKEMIDQIKAPIGLVLAQRDSRLLAISILAEIIDTARAKSLL